VNVPYEPALAPEVTVNTVDEDAGAAGARIATLGLSLGPAARRPEAPGGMVIWLTGLPGSGKTTLAWRLGERLAHDGITVAVLEWAALCALALPAGWITEGDARLGHRVLAYTAGRLADAGLMVVVDATAPRRAWRAAAREIAGPFAEIQLVCRGEVCRDRERAVRWTSSTRAAAAGPELPIDYEYSFHPDLVLDTEHRSDWSSADELVGFVRRRLASAASARLEVRHARS